MGLTADEKKLLDQLSAKANEPDHEDFEIEIFDGAKGARVPFSQGAKWLFETFGIGEPPAPAASADGGEGGDGGGQGDPAPKSYFGKRAAGK